MPYTVVWRPFAEARLAEIWLGASDRQMIADAADFLDDILRHNPHAIGESRTPDTHIAFRGPLGLLYETRDDDRMVAVLAVWRCISS